MTQMSNSSETQVSADASAVKDDFDATPPRETMLSSNHPVTKGASTLCFNKAALSRADFDLEHFIILARHRASLSQIHHDLRVYLKFVQNSMIELINDDYADFVNLSSNLVGLKETIDKLDANVKSVWNEFSSRTSKSMSIATNVVQYSSDLIKCRQRQAEIRTKLSLIKAIDRLAKILKDMPDELYVLSGSVVDLEVWFRKAHEQNEQIVESHDSLILAVCETVEDWLVHDMNADCKYIDALLDILMLVNGVNSAVCKVMDDVIDGRIEKCHNDNLEMLLKSIFVEINKIRENLLLKLTSNVDGCISSNVSDFLDRCLLTYVVSVLEKYFGSLLIPTDCRLFHRCYLETCEFIKKWPRNSAHSHTILRMIREKFNIVVYYKLETQQILSNLKKLAAEIVETNSLLNDLENSANNDDEQLFFQYSNAIIDSLKRVWSDDVYLATLVNKLWDFSMSVLINYVEWLETFTRSLVDVKNSDEVDIWRLVCVSISDAEVFDNRVFDLALSIIWDKIRELNLDVTPFGRCLSSFSSILNGKVEELKSSLAGMVVRKLSKVLDGVTDIPRNYRWTKKPLPTQESSYVSEAFALFDDFQNELKRYSWSEENTKKVSVEILTSAMGNFSKNAEQVFDSVEQTGSSLQRFKRRTATTGVPDSGNVDSDDNKIRTQLLLDLTICQDWLLSQLIVMSVTWSDIQRLAADLQRVQLTSESKRLSVKNCVEVVSILIKSGRLDVFFTIDGQFYVTKKHLLTEIKNECISTGGRIPLSSLVQALNIDYGAIESGVRTIVKHSSAFVLYNAELISKEYNNNLYVELNELLFESGVLSVLQLVKAWSLPLQFLNDFIFVEIGKKIKAIRDGDFIYTHEYFTEQKNLIRAIFNSLTKVTSVSKIMGTLNITTHLFWMLFDEQLAAHEIPGRIIGSRNSSLVLYMPNLHTELSRTYVAKTFASRQFIEMNVLKRLSIIDVPSFLQETLPPAVHKSLIFLTHTIISEKLLEEIFEALNTELSTTNFVDIRNCVPNQLESHSDTLALSSLCLKKNKDWFSSSDQLILYNNSLISETIKALDSFVNATAETEAKNIRIAQISNSRAKEKANEDNSAVTKGKKKAGKAKLQKQISTVERTTSPRLSTSAVMDELKRMKLFPEELIDDISEHIILQLDLRLRQRVLELLHTARSEAFVDHKRAYMQMQTKVSCMFESICVFEEGTSIFNEAVACDLRAYLMRTLCTDLAYDLLSFATGVDNISRNSVKIRDESIACIESKSGRETIGNLFTCLTTADLSAYHSELMRTCSTDMCSFNLKLPDKKRRAEIVEAYGNDMKRRLEACEDTASGLLIALLLIFAIEYKSAVHGSGKFVSHFIRKLATLPHFCSSTYDIILDIQRCVIDSLKRKDTEAITSLGRENLEKLKAILLNESTSHCVSDIS